MRKLITIFIAISFVSFLSVSCKEDTKKKTTEKTDEDTTEITDEDFSDIEVIDEIATDPDLIDIDETVDEDTVDPCKEKECPENSECIIEEDEAVCKCNKGYHPTNGECISDTELTEVGDFSITFSGQINQSNNPSEIDPGTGDAEFSYFDEDFIYTVVHVDSNGIVVDFPFAAVAEDGLITTTWIDKVSFSPKFFAINVPDNLVPAEDIDFVEKQVYALYGDLTYDGSNVGIKCIRAVSGEALLDLKTMTATDIELSASGKLIDPAYAKEEGYNLPDICED